MQETPDYETILACPMQINEAYADTIGDYLRELALKVWYEDEGFSGKRPFGDSGWKYEIYQALFENSLFASEYDDFDDVPYKLWSGADELIYEALQAAKFVIA